MIDDDVFFCLIKFVEPISIVVLLVVGIPLWIVGSLNKSSIFWSEFSSLPLFPKGSTTFPINTYYIKQSQQSQSLINVTIPITYDDYKKKNIFIIHNMWGFDIKATLFVNDAIIDTNQIAQNTNPSNSFSVQRYDIKKIPKFSSPMKKIQVADNYIKVNCPYSTAITEIKGIQPTCQTKALPIKFDSKYSINQLFSSYKLNYFDKMILNFDNSYMIPYNYIDTPELYIAYYGNSNKKKMKIAGIVLTSIGLVLIVGFAIFDCVVFVSYFAEDD